MAIFSPEGKLARILNRIGDLILLNILTLVCSLPVVTAGAAISALYHNTLLMVRNEEGRIAAGYFKSFRNNLKNATIIWLLGGGLAVLLLVEIKLLDFVQYAFIPQYKIVLFVLFLLVMMFTEFVLIVQSRFENTLKNTIKNGILFCILQFGGSILVFIIMLFPFALLFFSWRALSLIVLLGVSGPAFITSYYFRHLFDKYVASSEEEMKGEEDEE